LREPDAPPLTVQVYDLIQNIRNTFYVSDETAVYILGINVATGNMEKSRM
jgi:hypothetical protein